MECVPDVCILKLLPSAVYVNGIGKGRGQWKEWLALGAEGLLLSCSRVRLCTCDSRVWKTFTILKGATLLSWLKVQTWSKLILHQPCRIWSIHFFYVHF